MQIIQVSDRLSVAAQPHPGAFPELAAEGFTSVINNRPDGEDAAQPGTDAEAAAAKAAGLGYVHIPVSMTSITEADVRHFQSTLNLADGPVLAHCKSGMRSLILWSIGEVLDGRMRAEDVQAFGARHGIDLRAAVAWLARHGGRTQV